MVLIFYFRSKNYYFIHYEFRALVLYTQIIEYLFINIHISYKIFFTYVEGIYIFV